jgi:uncharacterized protein (TIGR02466 family)
MEAGIYSLFPTAVIRYNLGRQLTKKEMAFISKQETCLNANNKASKDNYVFRHAALSDIKKFAHTCALDYFNNIMCPAHEVTLQITQSWINFTKKGEGHHHHKHPNSILSGVFYIEADVNQDKIMFSSPVTSSNMECHTEILNLYNSKTWWLPVETGDLLVFPSTLYHQVPATDTEKRTSLSFNTFYIGLAGNETNLSALHVKEIGNEPFGTPNGKTK